MPPSVSGLGTQHRFGSPTFALPSNRMPRGNRSRPSPTRCLLRFTLALVGFALTAGLTPLRAQNYTLTTLAGIAGGAGTDDGVGSASRFNRPARVAVDDSGNIYVVDTDNHTVRKVTGGGLVTVLAGSPGVPGSTDGIGSAARFNFPSGVAEFGGTVYVADTGNHTIRKITSDGVVTTLAGTAGSTAGSSGTDDGVGSAARFSSPEGVAVDSQGNIYVADKGHHTIRKITSGGTVTTLAGFSGVQGSSDGSGFAVRFRFPSGVAVDQAGNVFVADTSNNLIRKVTSSGTVTTLAGALPVGSTDGTGTAARFNTPTSVSLDSAGNLYVADLGNSTIRKVTSGGVVTTLLGTAGSPGSVDGIGAAARLRNPYGVAVDRTILYVTDRGNHTVRIGTLGLPEFRGNSSFLVIFGESFRLPVNFSGALTVTASGLPADISLDPFARVISGTAIAQGRYQITLTGTNHDGSTSVPLDITTSFAPPPGDRYTFTTLAGKAGSFGNVEGTGGDARLGSLQRMAVDSSGNVYVAVWNDGDGDSIRKISRAGVVSTLAGGTGGAGSTDGVGSTARFRRPRGVAVDTSGNIYVSDTENHTIRKITAAGVVSTFAGTAESDGSANGTGSAARFAYPAGVAVDGAGNVYVADTDNNTIRKITSGGLVTTFAGSPGTSGSTNGLGAAARFSGPVDVAVDSAGNVYVADNYNHLIRKITSQGTVTTLAGAAGLSGSDSGTGTAARFSNPKSVAVDTAGNVFVADGDNHTVRKIAISGLVTTVAGVAGSSGAVNGTGGVARFNVPFGISVDSAGSVYVADQLNGTIRRGAAGAPVLRSASTASGQVGEPFAYAAIFPGAMTISASDLPNGLTFDPNGAVISGTPVSAGSFPITLDASNSVGSLRATLTLTVAGRPADATTYTFTTLAGLAGIANSTDGTGNAARFDTPTALAADSAGNLYVADQGSHTIRKITSAGVVSTLAGSAGQAGSANGTGSAARFNYPAGVAVDTVGNIYVSDTENHTIRKITSGGVVSTLAGTAGASGSTNSTGAAARFNSPTGLAVDAVGNIYVADSVNNSVRVITPSGVVTTLAGETGPPGSADGTGGAARFNAPFGIAVDPISKDVFVADTGNHTIRRIALGGIVTTLAGTAGSPGAAAGTGSAARFNSPYGVAVHRSGGLLVADSNNHTIRMITGGVVTTLGGAAGSPGAADAIGSATRFRLPRGIATDQAGNLYVADFENSTIRKGVPSTVSPTFTVQPVAQTVTVGTGVTFSVTATGTPTPTLQWRKDGVAIAGATASSLTLNAVSASSAGSYSVVATNSAGTVTSTAAVLTVTGPSTVAPSISLQPQSQVVAAGNSVTFTITANGTPTPTYQWRKDGNAISGATANSLVLSATTSSDTASYTVVVTNSAGTVTSTAAVLTVTGPSTVAPSISLQPQSQVVAAGNSVTFTVTATGTPTPTYQWRKDGNAISGATASSLVLSATTSSDTASYTVVVTNSAGSVTSAAAVLAVTAPVPVAPTITTQPQSQVVPAGTSVTLSVVATGTPPPTYQWRKDGNAISGATASSLVLSATTSSDTASYTVVVTNSAGSVTSAAAVLAVTAPVPVAPTITTQPQSRVVPAGTSVTFSVVATGTPPPTYQWRKDGNSIPGATASSLILTAVSTSSVGIYSVVATNSAGSVTSAAASLTVTTGGYTFSTLAGTAGRAGSRNGTGSAALFYFPWGVAVDAAGNVYVSEYDGSTIRKITSGGVVTTFAGSAVETGASDGTGAQARFNHPAGVAVDGAGNVYVADSYNHSIRKITAGGVVTTFAGSAAAAGSTDGVGTAARFSIPMDVAVDGNGNVYVADRETHTIRKITSNGVVTTLAGQPGIRGAINGIGSSARFSSPSGLVVGRSGRVYVADTGNHTIRMIDTDGTVSTIGGAAGSPGSADANGNNARFNSPYGVTVDRNDDLLVADTDNHTIRSFYGVEVSTLSGIAGIPGSADGPGSTARFNLPRGITMDQAGNLYVADYQNQTIRKGVPTVLNLPISAPVVTQSAAANGVVTLSVDSGGSSGSSYQWFRDGVAMPGATGSSLSLDVNAVGYPGSYTVAATNSAGSATSVPVVLKVTAIGPSSALSNLSVRTTMANGQVLIVGAVVNGGAKTILIRAGGPALNIFGLTGMVDPRLELYTTAPLPIATNDDWPAALTTTFSSLGAFSFSPGSKDAALSQALDGAFTVLARGTGPGTILVEAYDVTGGVSPRLVNLSARGLVGTGNDILIAGFNLTGTGTKQVLIRAIGPGLASFGVPGTLVDPKLQVFSSSGTVLAANDNWEAALALAFAKVGAFVLPSASRDAALLVTLDAGSSYTVQVSGADGGTGEALIEVYEIF